MSFTLRQEVKLKVVAHAGQVALEFLRANPTPNVDDVIKEYNRIFEQTYERMLVVTK